MQTSLYQRFLSRVQHWYIYKYDYTYVSVYVCIFINININKRLIRNKNSAWPIPPTTGRKTIPVNEGIVDDHHWLNCVMKCLCHSLWFLIWCYIFIMIKYQSNANMKMYRTHQLSVSQASLCAPALVLWGCDIVAVMVVAWPCDYKL